MTQNRQHLRVMLLWSVALLAGAFLGMWIAYRCICAGLVSEKQMQSSLNGIIRYGCISLLTNLTLLCIARCIFHTRHQNFFLCIVLGLYGCLFGFRMLLSLQSNSGITLLMDVSFNLLFLFLLCGKKKSAHAIG